jgi:hypothetical protein
MKKLKNEWLDRSLTICAYCYTLCLSEAEYHAQLKRLGVVKSGYGTFLNSAHGLKVHLIPVGKMKEIALPCAIVCVDAKVAKKKTTPQIFAALAHEAVHIWQAHARDIGAFNDHGDEEEAYAIQGIAQSLMQEYARRTTKGKKKK